MAKISGAKILTGDRPDKGQTRLLAEAPGWDTQGLAKSNLD